jgi:hypothetical protein
MADEGERTAKPDMERILRSFDEGLSQVESLRRLPDAAQFKQQGFGEQLLEAEKILDGTIAEMSRVASSVPSPAASLQL